MIASTGSQLLNQDKVPVALGFADSDAVLALAPQFQTAGVPLVTPGATSPKLPDQVGNEMFLACFGDNVQAAAGAEFVLGKLNGKTAYLLRDNTTEYTTLLAKYFTEAYENGGGKIVATDDYKHGDTSFTAQITKLEGAAGETGRALCLRPARRHRRRGQADPPGRHHPADHRRRWL